jgi:hypothetical protein
MGVEFNEESGFSGGPSFNSYRQAPQSSWMINALLKFGFAKNEKQANYVLIGIAVVAFAVTLYIIFGGSGSKPNPEGAMMTNPVPDAQAPQ